MGKSIQERLEELNNEVVGTKGYTRGQLSAAFSWVHDPNDWKAPVDTIIGYHALTVDLIMDAIMFFTATEAKAERLGDNLVRITAKGYRCGPAGDH